MADNTEVVILPSIKIEHFDQESGELNQQSVESPTSTENSFSRFGEASEEEIQRLLEDKHHDTESTRKATRYAVKLFREYLNDKGLDPEFEQYEKSRLNNILRKFYVDVRKRDGDFYKTSALGAIRFSLNRHLQITRNIDILTDPDFRLSDEVFKAQKVELRRIGKGIDHVTDITPEDLQKLYFSDVFNLHTPEGLIRKTFFDLMYLSNSKRSRGNLREQTRETFSIGYDAERKSRFIYLTKEEEEGSGYSFKIFEKKGNPRCPVMTFAKYISKLNPSSTALWQRPRKKAIEEDAVWYEVGPMGHNSLGKMMETISKEAKLSRVYSNNNLKGTHPEILDDPGLKNSMLVLTSKLVSPNGQVIQNIVPKPSNGVIASSNVTVIPVVPLISQSVASTNQNFLTARPSMVHQNNSNLAQTTPLNTPLNSPSGGINNDINQIQVVTLTTSLPQPFAITGSNKPVTRVNPSMQKSPLTCHVLDTSRGTPARQLPVKLFIEDAPNSETWRVLASSTTNNDGRVPNLLTPDMFVAGRYKVRFDTEIYFKSLAVTQYFYPYAEIVFIVKDTSQHYHIPLLLSPFGYTTYRGS